REKRSRIVLERTTYTPVSCFSTTETSVSLEMTRRSRRAPSIVLLNDPLLE
ncbi:hypothetical protein CSUI_005077, partial [Cystoisospora suis]